MLSWTCCNSCLDRSQCLLKWTSLYAGCDRSLCCLTELFGPKPVTEVTPLTRPQSQHALPFCPQNNKITYAAEFSREIHELSYSLPHSRSLENRWRLTFQALSTGRETPSRPLEPGFIPKSQFLSSPKIHTLKQFRHLLIVAPPSLHPIYFFSLFIN